MRKKDQVSPEEKLKMVKRYLAGETTQYSSSEAIGVSRRTFREWVSKYKSEGEAAFFLTEEQRSYSPELKKEAVEAYLAGQGSLQSICEKFKIRSIYQLRSWIKVYNRHGVFKQRTGGAHMTKARKTTQEERIQIAKECIAGGNNYSEVAMKYAVSYQQVYTWVKRYKELGEAGLEDRRGQRTAQQQPRTREEELEIQVAQLKHQLYMTEMENNLLKKLDELARRDALGK